MGRDLVKAVHPAGLKHLARNTDETYTNTARRWGRFPWVPKALNAGIRS